MKMQKTTRYALLFVAALAGGMALKNVFNPSTIAVLGLVIGILVGATLSKKRQNLNLKVNMIKMQENIVLLCA